VGGRQENGLEHGVLFGDFERGSSQPDAACPLLLLQRRLLLSPVLNEFLCREPKVSEDLGQICDIWTASTGQISEFHGLVCQGLQVTGEQTGEVPGRRLLNPLDLTGTLVVIISIIRVLEAVGEQVH
jgi:hypothetical protein